MEQTGTAAQAVTGGSSSISSNFNGTAIPSGDTIWFTAVFKVSGVPSQKTHIYFNSSTIQFTAGSTHYNVSAPGAVITIDPAATQATTTYDTGSGQWETTLPPQWSGNALLSAVELPLTSAIAGGVNPVTWSANFEADALGLNVNWAWAAAAYTQLPSTYGSLGVKPVDDNHVSQYQNSDPAGTPENDKSFVTGGARGGGGSNYTGSLSGTTSVTPSTSLSGIAPAAASPSIGSFAVYASESLLLDGNSLITGCAAGVENTTGPFLSGNASAYVNSGAKIQSTQTLYASSTYLNSGASLGPLDTSTLLGNPGATYGAVSGFPSSMPAPPPMPSATAGTTTIQLNSGTQTIAAGAYGNVTVNSGAKLSLSGGTYVFSSLTLNGAATLSATAATTLSVTGSANFGSGSFIGPASGSGLTAKSLVLYFDSSSNLNLNSGVQIQALVLATSAEVNVNTSQFTGALAAAQIVMNSGATVTCQDGFGSLVGGGCSGSCDDGNPCTADACSAGTCTHTPVNNGTSCSGTNLCEQTYTCQAGTCTGSNPVVCAASDPCHVAGTCNPSTGTCSNPAASNGTTCNDGDACTQTDTCQSGTCTGSNPEPSPHMSA